VAVSPVHIRWRDSHYAATGWLLMDEVAERMEDGKVELLIDTIGFLVHEDDTWLVVSHSYGGRDDNKQCCGLMHIPKSAVLRRTRIRLGK
jgi:hypothetical protein